MLAFGLVVVVGTIIGTQAQVPGAGRCPKVDTITNFEIDRYLGHWYEQARFPASFEKNQICANANYSLKEDGHIKVFNYGLAEKDRSPVNATGDAYVPDQTVGGKLKLRFSSFAPYGAYWIVDTDYDSYTLIYSCTDFLVAHLELAWILTRDKIVKPELRDHLVSKLGSFGVKTSQFIMEDQSNCPSYS